MRSKWWVLVVAVGSWAGAGWGADTVLNAADFGASGSAFSTPATTTAGSAQVTVKDPGDFRVGQGVMVSRCSLHPSQTSLWGPRKEYARSGPLKDLVELRGYDGSQGSWVVYIVDIDGADPLTFRWTDDLGRHWQGAGTKVTFDWQPLSKGVEVRLKPFAWADGYSAVIAMRDQLISSIVKIEGPVLTLKDAANRSATDAVVRHNDGQALQTAIDQAIAAKANLMIPVGTFRLARPLRVAKATSLTIAGANSVATVLDISEGEGACVELIGGTEVTLRDVSLVGHTGFADRDQCGVLSTRGGTALWGFYYKFCAALGVRGTERVLVENCHARRMSGECFYSGGPGRSGTKEPPQYTKEITYLRCTVEDCGRNAFNNNDFAENTRVLQCRIRDVGGCSWEGASRFVQFQGNYVRNGGTVAMGNIRSRDASLEVLPSGQHIVADNVFESGVCYGGCAVRAEAGATQVVIKNNLFVNHGTSAIELSGRAGTMDLPAGQSLVTGNIIDLTSDGMFNQTRHGVMVSASDATVADNQIYTRGAPDAKVTAVRLVEPAVNVTVSNNLIRNCGAGLVGARPRSRVTAVLSPQTFQADGGQIPLEGRLSHRYRGWHAVWLDGAQAVGESVLEGFDADQRTFKLAAPRELKVGQMWEIYPPAGPAWRLQHNTITDCLVPVALDIYGGPTAVLADNVLTRGDTTGVKAAIELRGAVQLDRNRLVGFDEPQAAALALFPDRFGQPLRVLCRDNIFQNCTRVCADNPPAGWAALTTSRNLFLDCATPPATGGEARKTPPPTAVVPLPAVARPRLVAPAPPAGLKLDGDVSEWPWGDAGRVITLDRDPAGQTAAAPRSLALAAADGQSLYVALKITTRPGYKPAPAAAPYDGDGMEIAFRCAEPPASNAILMLYGSANGQFWPHPAGGASAQQMNLLTRDTRYAVKAVKDGWTAEWQFPLAALGPAPATVKRLLFNVGLFHKADDQWVAWVATGAELFRVESAGEVVIQR